MEFNPPEFDKLTRQKLDLTRVFGEGTTKLVAQISQDNPALDENEVIEYAWSLIPEATAYMMPADPKDLTENAINIHEGYEAFRRKS
jgi:hypothetical protein